MLKECVDFLEEIKKAHKVTIALSNAGYVVLNMYGFYKLAERNKIVLEKEQGASFIFSGEINTKNFDLVVVAPCTANTVAKIACGIADTLVTNIVAQALKHGVDVCILPTDFKEVQKIDIPERSANGKLAPKEKVDINCRAVDIENVKRLEKTEGVTIIKNPQEILRILNKRKK